MKKVSIKGVLALLVAFFSIFGTGAFAAQQENLRHAGSSSIYFYNVEATDTHGSGKLMIDLDKHTFVFNGRDFTPSWKYVLRARAEGGTQYVDFALGKATPSGNLHIKGTWEAEAPPAEVATSTDYPSLYSIRFENDGWFIARIAFKYSEDNGVTWKETDSSGDITKFPGNDFNNVRWVDLKDFGVPVGALVRFHAIVVGGKDRTGSEVFKHQYCCYQIGGCCDADYHIKGTTGDPDLYYDGYTCNACNAGCPYQECNCPTSICF